MRSSKLSNSPTSWQLASTFFTLQIDYSLWYLPRLPHPLVPLAMCQAIFDTLHSLSHPGLSSFDIRTVHLAEYEAILPAGPIPTMTFSSQKCDDILKPHWRLSPHLTVVLTVFMWTLFGPYPSIQRLHLHLHLPILPLSQGNSNGWYHCWVLGFSPLNWLDLMLWCSNDNHLWPVIFGDPSWISLVRITGYQGK